MQTINQSTKQKTILQLYIEQKLECDTTKYTLQLYVVIFYVVKLNKHRSSNNIDRTPFRDVSVRDAMGNPKNSIKILFKYYHSRVVSQMGSDFV